LRGGLTRFRRSSSQGAFGNGTTATWTYDDEDWAATIEHRCPDCVGGQAEDFVSLEYDRDGEGSPLFRRHKHDTGNSQWYRYDGADRLVNFRRGGLF
jgi:uncharacterized protein RhaS with RHS repeats